ncbi:DNA cytosine methyltransferase [Alkalihalobacterium elongatum]|uniref:DNA cytosine methyltransferase n=1 Tax=Alkalihalobacterium elongatum TaxID=2675466 RepID=UPI001C2002A3|nr:DNA cytosine methyltransferase [Alkalihalobacterium elongatum]
MLSTKYTSIDLFSGPGGLCTGLKLCGIKPLIAVEISKESCETYSHSHNADLVNLEELLSGKVTDSFLKESQKTIIINGDIRLLNNEILLHILKTRFNRERVDIVTGGAPCEGFSMAGKRNVNDNRNTLYLEIIRISKLVQTKMILFENVKAIKTGNYKRFYQGLIHDFRESGFTINEDVLNAAYYGVPQKRERYFMVGIDNKFSVAYEFSKPTHGPGTNNPFVSTYDALDDLSLIKTEHNSSDYTFDMAMVSEKHRKEFLDFVRGSINVPPYIDFETNKINDHLATRHKESQIVRFQLIKQGENMKQAAERLMATGQEENRNMYFPKRPYAQRNRRLIDSEPSHTVTAHCNEEILHYSLDRAITGREAARLQSFPDWYIFGGPKRASSNNGKIQDKYKQVGDAVPPLLAFRLGEQIIKTLDVINLEKKPSANV